MCVCCMCQLCYWVESHLYWLESAIKADVFYVCQLCLNFYWLDLSNLLLAGVSYKSSVYVH